MPFSLDLKNYYIKIWRKLVKEKHVFSDVENCNFFSFFDAVFLVPFSKIRKKISFNQDSLIFLWYRPDSGKKISAFLQSVYYMLCVKKNIKENFEK